MSSLIFGIIGIVVFIIIIFILWQFLKGTGVKNAVPGGDKGKDKEAAGGEKEKDAAGGATTKT
jgi:preprotein translocase subunit SecG